MQKIVRKRPKMSTRKVPKTYSDLEQRKAGHFGHVRLRILRKRDDNNTHVCYISNFPKKTQIKPYFFSLSTTIFQTPLSKVSL